MINKIENMELKDKEIAQINADLKNNLDRFFKENDIDTNRIDIFGILKKMGFTILYGDLKENEGIILVDENRDNFDGFKTNKLIAADTKSSYEHSVFVLAHELAHYLSQKWIRPEQKICFNNREEHNSERKRTETEDLMDYIGASILLPEEPFRKALTEYGINDITDAQESDIKVLAGRYGLEQELVKRRIAEVLK